MFYCADTAGDESSADPVLTAGQTYLERMEDDCERANCDCSGLYRMCTDQRLMELFVVLFLGGGDTHILLRD